MAGLVGVEVAGTPLRGAALFNSLVQPHHCLGHTQPVGEHLKYLVYARGRPIACVA